MDENKTNRKEELKELLHSRLEDPAVCMPSGDVELTEEEIWASHSYILREAIARNLPDALEIVDKNDLQNETVFLLADYLKLKVDMKIAELIAAPGLAKIITSIMATKEDFGDTL